MRDTTVRRMRIGPVLVLGGAMLGAGGCAHNDVMVFGTSTTLGLNVQTAAATGAAPSIVLGYERTEAVWMPLLANGIDSRAPNCVKNGDGYCTAVPAPPLMSLDDTMYQSTTTRGQGADQVVQTDTYSVFASLGAKFDGKAAAGPGVEASGGLAQFFATGIAAVNISQNAALVTALKVESSDGADAQARAVEAAVTGEPAFDALVNTLSASDRLAADAWVEAHTSIIDARMNRIAGCSVDPTTGGWRWPAIAAGMTVSSTLPQVVKDNLAKITNERDLRRAIETDEDWQIDAERSAKALTFC